jgi:5-formaminoimidazole-4-carboxamide-1-(beta)-D-ribofuranosyl 5'-monophosphate synthetase
MIAREKIWGILDGYDEKKLTVGVIGSHSALEIAHGVKQEGLQTLVVCQEGREKTYTRYYRNLFDHVLLLPRFADMVREENQEKMRELSTIFVPSRSFSVYVGYDNIEKKFEVPLLGNRYMLRTEERSEARNQYYLLKKAVLEEYVIGAKFNANFFWSPLTDELDLLGFDRRIQTNLDGVLSLPADEQLEVRIPTQNIEIGHVGATLRESQLEKIFEAGERFVGVCKEEYPPGIIGLFALQGAVNRELEFYVFDVSPRIPGCPCVGPTSPYMRYKYGMEVGPGRRVALEIKRAAERGELKVIVT